MELYVHDNFRFSLLNSLNLREDVEQQSSSALLKHSRRKHWLFSQRRNLVISTLIIFFGGFKINSSSVQLYK